MNVERFIDKNGNVVSFGLERAFISVNAICRVLSRIKGVSDIVQGNRGEDVKLRFSFRGIQFVVIEPWNDSSEYVVTLYNDRPEAAFQGLYEIEAHFRQHELAFFRWGAGWALKVIDTAVLFPGLVVGKGIAFLKRRR